MAKKMKWETVIGLEIHVQLSTQSKIFSAAATAYGARANTQACAVDLGLPGVLPVLNEAAVHKAIAFGLAVNAEIARHSVFARKNYFYPDLPKGYQISQLDLPIVGRGRLTIQLEDGSTKCIGITRAHLEEDAGKSVHEGFGQYSGIDLNRAGTPLMEIVSEPDLRSADEALAYMKKIHALVRYLDISDGNMQEGSLRCDANVSVRPPGQRELGTRTELKNINSFRFVQQALRHESARQIAILEDGGQITQETRLYDPQQDETRPMRSKEEAHDYRYFPDPDLLPLELLEEDIEAIRQTLPELPDARYQRFIKDFGLPAADSQQLTASKALADYFEAVTASANGEARLSANWILGALSAALKRDNRDIVDSPLKPALLGGLIRRIKDQTLSGKLAKQVFEAMWDGEGTADAIIAARGLEQLSDAGALEALVAAVIAENPAQVEQYRSATAERQQRLIGYFVGQVMKRCQGKANPQQVNALLKDRLQ